MNLQEQERAAEQWLDEAIEQCRLVGPRAGLETRILSGLRVRAEQRRRRWTFALAASAAVMLVAALMASWPRSKPEATPTVVQKTAPVAPARTAPTAPVASAKQLPKRKYLRVREPREVETASLSKKPLLRPRVEARAATFPAAAPLTDQGRLLQAYLRQTPPRELALIAARQSSSEKLEDLKIAPLQIKDLTPKPDVEKD